MAEQTEKLDEQIIALSTEDKLDNKAVVEKLKEQEIEVTPQKVAAVISKYNKSLESTKPKQEVVPKTIGCQTYKAEEYMKMSKAAGRTEFGGEKGVKVKATIEELRALINSNWTPELCMEKWQMSEDELTQLVWALSSAELRDKPIVCNFKQNFFR